MTVRLRLDLAYDGGDFAGWARQPEQRTVQGVLEDALHRLFRTEVALTVAGRTDSGVHATGQVAHADVPSVDEAESDGSASLRTVVRRLAGILPPDVRVLAAVPVSEDFDARFSALARRYVYRIGDAAWGVPPLRRHDTLAWPRPLDEELMHAAAQPLVGMHDFAAYCRRREGATTVRELQRLACERAGDRITVTVVADAFCHQMVRSLVGALLAVGDGRRTVDWPESLLSRGTRADDVQVAPAYGLCLAGVDYPPDSELAERAQLTRARRDMPGIR